MKDQSKKSEVKWTKGPWETNRAGYLMGSNGKRVVMYGLSCSHAMVSPSVEERANARIAESAPDLYAALDVAYKLLQSMRPDCDCVACMMDTAALAKARGDVQPNP